MFARYLGSSDIWISADGSSPSGLAKAANKAAADKAAAAWAPPNHLNVKDNILKLSGQGQARFQNWFNAMVIDGVKPSMAGDIWSDGGCSLMGMAVRN